MRIRFAVGFGALLLAGGIATGGAVAFASDTPSEPRPAPSAPQAPSQAPTDAPRPSATRAPEPDRSRPSASPQAPRSNGKVRVPTAVPAGPTGDLHLPAIRG
ncbi:hypothetical protein [Amycolatopsis jiangsuensis]|uniref:Uncharacterized protein n=1 Tax=Amycolatopsis jiangsuensis TaxID=1181879 RepID=A0A840IVW9_9PSEU|nr:hypothetical protein [Amycolatopsis jiangsuensis]MBB4686706.1 hypothetical protein [Amycolatopsis jiangsuensis]